MALAFDATSEGSYSTGTSFSWTHTPVGTPRGVWVGTTEHETESDDVSAVSYGGVAMTLINSVQWIGAEDGTAKAWFLGTNIPAGAQTVLVTTGTPGGAVAGYAVTVTASVGNATRLAGIGSATNNVTTVDPSVTITGIAGASYGFGVLFSGRDSEGLVTAGTGQTMRQQFDSGGTTGHAESSTNPQASGDMTIGFVQLNDEAALVGVAIEEYTAVADGKNLTLLGVGT